MMQSSFKKYSFKKYTSIHNYLKFKQLAIRDGFLKCQCLEYHNSIPQLLLSKLKNEISTGMNQTTRSRQQHIKFFSILSTLLCVWPFLRWADFLQPFFYRCCVFLFWSCCFCCLFLVVVSLFHFMRFYSVSCHLE